jgi:hypothetical protein
MKGDLEPPGKRHLNSSRLLSYDSNQTEHVSLSKKLNEIPFPSKIPNSPHSIRSITPATPISLAMEHRAWMDENIHSIHMNS